MTDGAEVGARGSGIAAPRAGGGRRGKGKVTHFCLNKGKVTPVQLIFCLQSLTLTLIFFVWTWSGLWMDYVRTPVRPRLGKGARRGSEV